MREESRIYRGQHFRLWFRIKFRSDQRNVQSRRDVYPKQRQVDDQLDVKSNFLL